MKSKNYIDIEMAKSKKINITIYEKIDKVFLFPDLRLNFVDSHIHNEGDTVYFVYTLVK